MNRDQNNIVRIKTVMPSSRSQNFSVAFKQQLEEDEEQFRERLSLPLENTVGPNGWALVFKRLSSYEKAYQVDIYTDKPKHYEVVQAIIGEKISDRKLQFFYQGAVQEYINK